MALTNKIEQMRDKRVEVKDTLQNLTYDQINTYIDNNITDLVSAKEYLKKLSKIVLHIEKTKGK